MKGRLLCDVRLAFFTFHLRKKSKQNKNDHETNQADADEGHIAQCFTPCRMIGFVAISKKGGTPL
jgi:hypothetical protein